MSEVIVSVNGLDIKENSLYKIKDKPDNNALDGLREFGSTKIPQDFMATIVQCPWDSATGTFDTGLYVHSPCYKGLDHNVRTKIVKSLQERIVEPYERIYGFGILDNKNEKFWEETTVELEQGRIFNTANVKDLLELYIAMRGFELTPKQSVGDPRFRNSQFIIEDREVTSKRRDERAQNYMNTLQTFFVLLTTAKHKLVAVLKYANMNGARSMNLDTPDSTLNSLFKDWIDSDSKNVDTFLRISGMVDKAKGMEELTFYSLLLDMNDRNKLIKVGEEYTYDDVPLGADLKTVAKNLVSKKTLKPLKEKILQEETEE